MSTDGSNIPAIRGSRIFGSEQTSAVRKRIRAPQTTQGGPVVHLKDRILNSAEGNPFSPNIERYQEAADRARQDQRKVAQTHREELQLLQQRHHHSEAKQVAPPLPKVPQAPPSAAELLGRFGADALFRAHIDERSSREDVASKLAKAQALTAAASAAPQNMGRGLEVAARAQRLTAAQQQLRADTHRDSANAKRELEDTERKQRYAQAMAEEHARREAHSRFVRDLLLETYSNDFTSYEPAFTGKLDDPYFVEPYPTEVPLTANGNIPKVTVGPSGVPHGHALKLPNQAKYDHATDQYTDEVRPFYKEDAPLLEKKMAGPLTLPSTSTTTTDSNSG